MGAGEGAGGPQNYTPNECGRKMPIYTRNECGRCKTTLQTSVEDVELHSKRVYFSNLPLPSKNYTLEVRQGPFHVCLVRELKIGGGRRGNVNGLKTTLETSGEVGELHQKRVEKLKNYTRNERRS
jgi:hypothetical protein